MVSGATQKIARNASDRLSKLFSDFCVVFFFVEIFLSFVAGGGEVWSDAHGESLYTSGAFRLLERELV